MIPAGSSRLADFQPGDIVDGRYRILHMLADGGMGSVFLAEHMLIKRRVAIKRLHAELAEDGVMVQRFLREATAAGTLGHPHIVESTDMGFTRDGTPYIIFEYLEGCLLTEEIHRLGRLPVRRAVTIARQLASALEAAHGAQIAHLDLKSDNVFLTDKGEALDHAKLLDFGISRFMAADVEATQPGILMGTPEFMAPEQVTTPDDVDGRADIYALGVVLYEMLAGRCPHVSQDQLVLLHRIVWEPPPPLECMVSPALAHLLFEGMLVKQRERRLQTMREVKDALDEIAAALAHVPTALDSFVEGDEAVEGELEPRELGDSWTAGVAQALESFDEADAAGGGAEAPEWVVESWFPEDDPRNEVTHGGGARQSSSEDEWVVEVW